MKTKLLISITTLCFIATPAMADLFDFTYGSVNSSYTYSAGPPISGTFTASADKTYPATGGTVERFQNPTGVAQFSALANWAGPEDVSLTMSIINIGSTTADGVNGLLTLTDTSGDTITADVAGTWQDLGPSNYFGGLLSNVVWGNESNDNKFDGHSGSISMSFNVPQAQWYGTILELSTTGTWFSEGSYTSEQGSLEGSVVPVPAAVLLGILGLGVAGIKLRKFA